MIRFLLLTLVSRPTGKALRARLSPPRSASLPSRANRRLCPPSRSLPSPANPFSLRLRAFAVTLPRIPFVPLVSFVVPTPLRPRLRCAACSFLLLALSLSPALAAPPDVILPGVPTCDIITSSHSAAAAMVVSYLGVTKDDKRPPQALVGDLEGKMFHCECGQKLYFWDVKQGLDRWAAARGATATIAEGCLRSNHPEELVTLDTIAAELAAGRPVIATFSFSEASATNLAASAWSQQRFSAVLVGLQTQPDGSRGLLVQLPGRWEKQQTATQVRKLFGLPAAAMAGTASRFPGEAPGNGGSPPCPALSLPWPPACPNLIFTMVRDLRPAPPPAP